MKKTNIFFLFTILVLSLQPINSQWTKSKLSPGGWLTANICFKDGQTGFVSSLTSSRGGAIFVTTNGGENWEQKSSYTDKGFTSMFFLDGMNGYAVGPS